jgi:membrane associated rhomboid family serine protease
MIPLYDTVRPHKVPVVNYVLIAANILTFLYEIGLDSTALRELVITWGLTPALLAAYPHTAWVTIFTSMFLHGGWFHMLTNMWVLFIFGDNVEARMGGAAFSVFYVLSGVAAGLLQAFLLPSSMTPVIGASGAIAGVLGAYLVLYPRSRIASLVPIFFIFTLVEVPAFVYLAFWFISQLFSGLMSFEGADSSGIAWWAHVGGFVFGIISSLLFARKGREIRGWYD